MAEKQKQIEGPNAVEIGKRLLEARKILRLSMRQVRDKTGIPIASISVYEKGKQLPTLYNFYILSSFYIKEIERLRLATYFDYNYLLTGVRKFDQPIRFYVSRAETLALGLSAIFASGAVERPQMRNAKTHEYFGLDTMYGDLLANCSREIERATESFGLRDKDHIFEDLFNAILQTTVSFDSQGFYGDVIEWSISAGYSYDAVISSCPTAYVEENFPEEKSKYLKRPTYEERVRYAHSCSFGSIRISDVFFELRPENIWGYADEQLGLE